MRTSIFNVCRVTLITCHLQKIDPENLVKHAFGGPKTGRTPWLKLLSKFFLLGFGTMVHYSYMQYISHYLQFRIKCNMRTGNAGERKYISLLSTIGVYD